MRSRRFWRYLRAARVLRWRLRAAVSVSCGVAWSEEGCLRFVEVVVVEVEVEEDVGECVRECGLEGKQLKSGELVVEGLGGVV